MGIVFSQLCNALEPRVAVAFSSASLELWEPTQAQRQQLRTEHEAAAGLCDKMGLRSCKELREAKAVHWISKDLLSATDLATLGSLGSLLPALELLNLFDRSGTAGPEGMQRLAAGLVAGALPAVNRLFFHRLHVGDSGALALAAALRRGALPRIKQLHLGHTAIGDAGLVALAPALRRLPALEDLRLNFNPLGAEGLAALVAPPPPAGALPPPPGGLAKLKELHLFGTRIADNGCAALAAVLDSGVLPALEVLDLRHIPASDAAQTAVAEALARSVERERRISS